MKQLFFTLLLLVSIPVSAKLSQFIFRTRVYEQNYSARYWEKTRVDSIYVSVVKNDTVMVPFKILSGNDTLKLSTQPEMRLLVQGGVGDYSLILNADGYEPLRHDFKVASEGQDVVYIRELNMEKLRTAELHEVSVVGTAIKVVMKGDTLVYDSRAFKVAEGSSLDALVRQLPGAELGDDGTIRVNGRPVSSLLLNGNDFFHGDPNVALKNLPAYTVDKIKVYDKAGKEDYLTLQSQRLTDSPEEENLVMDVILKKEFQMATICNIEGGYGPGIYNKETPQRLDNRYLGRAFIVGFGKTYRFSAFGNVNNIKNHTKASSENKDWGYDFSFNGTGQEKSALGGFDFFFNPGRKWELSGDMTYERIDFNRIEHSAETRFFDMGNLYQRSLVDQQTLRHNINAKMSLRYLGDNVSVYFTPRLDWQSNRTASYNYQATFSQNPFESYRGAAIDSVFFLGARRNVLNTSISATNADYSPEYLTLKATLNVIWRPKAIRGIFRLSATGEDVKSADDSGVLYDQPYLADQTATPVRQNRWANSSGRNSEFGTNISYEWNKRLIGSLWIHSLEVKPAIGWDVDRNFSKDTNLLMLLAEGFDSGNQLLPSVTAPENLLPFVTLDGNNSVKSLKLDNDLMARINLKFTTELAAPSDSGFNPNISLVLSATHRQYWRHFTYAKTYLEPDPFSWELNRNEPIENVNLSLNFGSSNRREYFNIEGIYRYSQRLVNLSALVPTVSDANPLYVALGPEDGQMLKSPSGHTVSLRAFYHNMQNFKRISFYANYVVEDNLTSRASIFDPTTGVTTSRPINVNGVWHANGQAYATVPIGPREQKRWYINGSLSFAHDNNVDYVSTVGTPLRSVVKADRVGGHLDLVYTLKNGSGFVIGGGTEWQHTASAGDIFSPLTSWNSSLRVGSQLYLPAQIVFETHLSAQFRRGYEDSVMNKTEWVWNAQLEKSFFKGAFTVKLQAVDILGQLTTTNIMVNAAGRTETWTNNLPRYALLTLSYRFAFTPKSLQ